MRRKKPCHSTFATSRTDLESRCRGGSFAFGQTQIENSNCRFCVMSVMERAAILEHLEEAERLVADSECQIARQKAILSRLVMDDLDAALAAHFRTRPAPCRVGCNRVALCGPQ